MAAKAVVDDSDAPSDSQLVDALHALTTVRAVLADGLASGQRNDAPDSAIAMRQRWRLAELRAEEYAFVLLSRFISMLAGQVCQFSAHVSVAKTFGKLTVAALPPPGWPGISCRGTGHRLGKAAGCCCAWGQAHGSEWLAASRVHGSGE